MLIRQKFAFYHIPRTGGQSIEHVLNFDKQLEHPPWIRVGHVHEPLCDKAINIELYDIFTNIRNPFDRLVSLYEMARAGRIHNLKLDKSVKFKEFIYDHWDKNPTNIEEYHTTEGHLFIDDRLPENVTLIKTEEMNWRWPEVINEYFGIKGIKIPHKNAIPHADSMTYYDNDLINFVRRREDWVLQFYN